VTAIRHYFTVDVEEHFQVSAFEDRIPRSSWASQESRVAASVDRLLEVLAAAGARGTFFVLGLVAERTPSVVHSIHAAGHEIASHGWDHRRVTELSPAEFRDSVRRSKRLLEDMVGSPVLGYRAPSYSIVAGKEWALDVLAEEGYTYDSSLFPVRRPGYGYADGERDPHWLERPAGRLAELPPATWRVLGANLPAAGGAYFRIFPYRLVRAALRQCEARGVPGVFYLHPWEVDPEQPRLPVRLSARLRHYTGLHRTLPRLRRLLAEFRFTAIADGLREPAAIGAP
jgi:polysaccharide deacetylase family protein (PEP-CTERM system associated)